MDDIDDIFEHVHEVDRLRLQKQVTLDERIAKVKGEVDAEFDQLIEPHLRRLRELRQPANGHAVTQPTFPGSPGDDSPVDDLVFQSLGQRQQQAVVYIAGHPEASYDEFIRAMYGKIDADTTNAARSLLSKMRKAEIIEGSPGNWKVLISFLG